MYSLLLHVCYYFFITDIPIFHWWRCPLKKVLIRIASLPWLHHTWISRIIKRTFRLTTAWRMATLTCFVIVKLLFRAVGFSYGHAGDYSFDNCSQTKLFSESLKYDNRMVHTRGHLIERTASREVTGIWGSAVWALPLAKNSGDHEVSLVSSLDIARNIQLTKRWDKLKHAIRHHPQTD